MSVLNNITFIFITTAAMSYGWGMRGTTIGGEKGAMLPGAIAGVMLALFSGSPFLLENFFFLSALGSMGMYYGGCMTYGETLSLSLASRPAPNMKKGLFALFVKGFLWFAVFAEILTLGIAALTGKYFSVKEIIVMFLLMPVVMITFLFIFNRPHNKEEKIFPKIYFSVTRKESWGAMFGLFALLFIIAIVKKIPFVLEFTLVCALFGGVGWVIAQLAHVFCLQYSKDFKNPFLKMFSKRSVSPWKVMECVLGAFAGLGISIAFILFQNAFKKLASFSSSGFWAPTLQYDKIFTYIFLIILAFDMLHYFTKSKKIQSIAEVLEFPFYATIPTLLVFLGNKDVAQLSSFFVIYWVFVQEISFEKPNKLKHPRVFKPIFTATGIAIIIAQLCFDVVFSLTLTVLLYGVFYEVFTLIYLLQRYNKNTAPNYDNSFKKYLFTTEIATVHTYFIVCIIIFTSFILFY
ncbi:MAG TPA: hypothetical protein VFC76_06920 [Oscillospiraceae bacterium]|nr:hypothetical protein [Oscillospiraceae bacterium]